MNVQKSECVKCKNGDEHFLNCDSCTAPYCTNCTEVSPEELAYLTALKRKLKFVCQNCENEVELLKKENNELKMVIEKLENTKSGNGEVDVHKLTVTEQRRQSRARGSISEEHVHVIKELLLKQEYINFY